MVFISTKYVNLPFMNFKHEKLPTELTALVHQSLNFLGEAIRQEYGNEIYKEIEKVRQNYKGVRGQSNPSKQAVHLKTLQQISKKSPQKKFAMAHAFAVSLELINLCENAHRSFRLSQKKTTPIAKPMDPIIFVLTAHPTEARSANAISVINEIYSLLRLRLESPQFTKANEKALFHLILMLLKIPISKPKAPTVQDEADYIYSTVLKPETIQQLCQYEQNQQPVYIRTWVGGDKDGHPGVNDKVMLSSLSLSRQKILPFVSSAIDKCRASLQLLDENSKSLNTLKTRLVSLSRLLKGLKTVRPNDGQMLTQFYKSLDQISSQYKKVIGLNSPDLDQLQSLLRVFPGLVVPLELREDAALIAEALEKPNMEIARMLKALKDISKGGHSTWYARGFIISMCEASSDVKNALQLLKTHTGKLEVPVVPLFETRQALDSSSQLTKQILEIPQFKKSLKQNWGEKLEIMLGYSDSSKESGALYSRVMIQKTLTQLDQLIRQQGYTPIFFHGSGGSVARGGGSLKDQICWWPKSAQKRFKATIQGEMIHRTFSSPEIFNSQVQKIRDNAIKPLSERPSSKVLKEVREFADLVRLRYLEKVNDSQFMEMVEKATPYPYLDQLRIGSRPSKRKAKLSLKSLRAIPWILCWTQTRTLFPVWWGIGSSFDELPEQKKKVLKQAFKDSSLFRSFVEVLAYTLAKVDLSVWAFYLSQSTLSETDKERYLQEFEKELKKTTKFVQEISDQKSLLWFRPWLEESIKLRSTMIYPLNILEVEALRKKEVPLVRETVTGVASGMLTTG